MVQRFGGRPKQDANGNGRTQGNAEPLPAGKHGHSVFAPNFYFGQGRKINPDAQQKEEQSATGKQPAKMVQNPVIGGLDLEQKIGRVVKAVYGGSEQQKGRWQKNG